MITLALDGKRRVEFGVGTVAAVISALISFATMSIPKPEIYTTNENIVEDNGLFFKTEWPLTVKYSLVYNRDPMILGGKHGGGSQICPGFYQVVQDINSILGIPANGKVINKQQLQPSILVSWSIFSAFARKYGLFQYP